MPTCPNCMASNPEGTAYCPYCGAAQSQQPAWKSEPVVSVTPEPVPPVWEQAPTAQPEQTAPVAWDSNPDPKPEQVAAIAWQSGPTPQADPIPPAPASVPWQAQPQQTSTPWQQPVYAEPHAPAQVPRSAKILSIISMVCGLGSVTFFWSGFFAVMLGVAALVLRGIAARRMPQGVRSGMLKTGLITGIIGIVLGVIFLFLGGILDTLFWESAYSYSDFYL